ncbi:MAG: mannose-6-phosphate isomerase [Porphyromonadaceae bacterium CG2_30_38_12]|nr:MAG: mannose-6-phosphate isomerase [Porphyromonadaceae bacterium CG2_30_38_12]
MNNKLYPLKFTPILKDKIWGGTKLKTLFGKDALTAKLGESWELSGIENEESVVSNGFLAGNKLSELIEIYMGDLVGDEVFDTFGHSFPLLFKLIDANENLSIQVHPGDEVAAQRHNSLGKTEMWVVLDADPGAELIIGFRKDCSQEQYVYALENEMIEELLQGVPVVPGDVFFIPAGLVHAIGKGIVVAEIQQSSDITYRIYDFKRKDDAGNERELHTEQALEVIDFNACKNPKTQYSPILNALTPLVSCEYFTTNMIQCDKALTRNYGNTDSFVVYMCTEGKFLLEAGTEKLVVVKGDTVLIPACLNEIEIIPETKTKLLEVYI